MGEIKIEIKINEVRKKDRKKEARGDSHDRF
jgi:hypothetical protein